MDYKVIITDDAFEDLDNILYYLLFVLKNEQAAQNVLSDFELTKEHISHVAGSLKLCENSKLREKGYRRLEFQKHSYFLLYRIEGSLVIVDAVFHDLQDFEKRMK